VFLIIFFIWRNREPFRRIGWRFAGRRRDVVIGLVLFIPVTFVARLLDLGLEHIGLKGPSGKLPSFLFPHGPWQIALAVLMVLVVAWSEETMFRGYLILRLSAATRSVFWAVVLSTIIFALGHGYEGLAGMITVAYLGLVFALVYVWRRSLVAPMVMHFLQDFTSIIIVAALAQK
jgi:membrane protease YdiL (CAAX protease family)